MKPSSPQPVKQRRTTDAAAQSYVRSRDPSQYSRTAREEAIVRNWLRLLPSGALIFDCPCGTGRFVRTAEELGFRYVGGDVASPMIKQARQISASPKILGFVSADAESLPLHDNAVDCVLLWRLLHHISDAEVRQQMLREAARVSRRLVLVSFHHPISFTFVRRLAQRVIRRDWEISDITHWRLAREADRASLEMVETQSFGKFRSINWFALLRKK